MEDKKQIDPNCPDGNCKTLNVGGRKITICSIVRIITLIIIIWVAVELAIVKYNDNKVEETAVPAQSNIEENVERETKIENNIEQNLEEARQDMQEDVEHTGEALEVGAENVANDLEESEDNLTNDTTQTPAQ